VGDPARDVFVAWTLFTTTAREGLRSSLGADEAIWAGERG